MCRAGRLSYRGGSWRTTHLGRCGLNGCSGGLNLRDRLSLIGESPAASEVKGFRVSAVAWQSVRRADEANPNPPCPGDADDEDYLPAVAVESTTAPTAPIMALRLTGTTSSEAGDAEA